MSAAVSAYKQVRSRLVEKSHVWLITGVAGFIGSNLLEVLLRLNQRVVGLDNYATGHQHNLKDVQTLVGSERWSNFSLIEGDIRNLEDCRRALRFPRSPSASPSRGHARSELAENKLSYEFVPVEYVLHQAALGSVPRSVENPIATNSTNVDGFLNMLVAARDANVKRFVYAASSSTYGDDSGLPKVEDKIGSPLSPYAVTKYVNELYAEVFSRTYSFNTIGLRYFNAFGPRQDPDGVYAAVIPKWIASMIKGEPVYINGDGETSRDFCFIENVVQLNLLAAMTEESDAVDHVYNVAVGDKTTLNQLYEQLHANMVATYPHLQGMKPVYRDFRAGDVRHSLADISKAARLLGYQPTHRIGDGLKAAMEWYVQRLS